MKGGQGGKSYYDNQDKGNGPAGGQGQVTLITTKPIKLADLPGEIQHMNGGGGDLAVSGNGYQGTRGGGASIQDNNGGGGGGGGAGFSIRMTSEDPYVFIAGVGGTGGKGCGSSAAEGGRGANLPGANGSNGVRKNSGTGGEGGTMDDGDSMDPTYNPTPTAGSGGGGNRKYACGGGGGGWGGGKGGIPGGSEQHTTGGGGGASWSRPVGFILGDIWEVTLVNSGYDQNALQQLASTSLVNPGTTWTTLGTQGAGNRPIKDIAS